jgi:hypothetical protein
MSDTCVPEFIWILMSALFARLSTFQNLKKHLNSKSFPIIWYDNERSLSNVARKVTTILLQNLSKVKVTREV